MNTADVLDKAADVIVKRGWGQGDAVTIGSRGPKCAALGISYAAPSYVEIEAANAALTRWVLIDSPAPDGMSIIYWNDDPSRTADEVIAALRGCAANLRAGAS